MTDQSAGPRTLTVHWHPDALHKAIERATAATANTEADQPVQLPWIDVACLLDIARAWMSAQETEHPAELVEVPGISPAEFEAFKTRWQEHVEAVHGPRSAIGLGFPPADWPAAIDYFDELKFNPEPHDPGIHGPDGYAPGVEQRIAELSDATGTFTDDAYGRSP